MSEEDYGPLFEGTERDLYRLAFEHVTALANESTGQDLIAVYCENCGKPADKLERCDICLFYWCVKCFSTLDHTETHRVNARNEERA